jgi:beta-lactamase class A
MIAKFSAWFIHGLLVVATTICVVNANDLLSATKPTTNKPNNCHSAKLARLHEQLAKLEASSGGRLGVAAIDTANNRHIHYKAQQRFPLCSTSKLMAVSAVLNKSMQDTDLLQKNIIFSKQDVGNSHYAPITAKYLASGMSIASLCAAAIAYSDNTAMNLLLHEVGGPHAVTSYARSIGDSAFNLVRIEPELNTAIPGELRDTTTPAAMAESLRKLTLGGALALPQQNQLLTWLKSNTTGATQIRAGVPSTWVVADKTGMGDYGISHPPLSE